MKNHKVKKITGIIAAATIALGITACGSADSSTVSIDEPGVAKSASAEAEKTVIRFADMPGFFPVVVAQEKGFFDEQLSQYNATVEVIEFTGGGPAVNESFTAKEIEFAIMGDLPVASAVANGNDNKIIGYSSAKGGDDVLVVRADSGIEKPADLAGHKIGVAVGQISHGELLKILQSAGLSESDVEIVNLSNADCVAALEAGEIDATQNYLTNVAPSIESGADFKVIADAKGLGFSNIVFAARNDYITENPEIATAVVKALNEAIEFINSNKEEAVAIVSRSNGKSENVNGQIYDVYDHYITIGDTELANIQQVFDFAYDNGLITTAQSTDNIVDLTYLKNAGLE